MAFIVSVATLTHTYGNVRDIPTLIQSIHPAAIFIGVGALAAYIYGSSMPHFPLAKQDGVKTYKSDLIILATYP